MDLVNKMQYGTKTTMKITYRNLKIRLIIEVFKQPLWYSRQNDL